MMVTNGSRPYGGKSGYPRSAVRKAAGVIDFNEADRRLAQAKQRFAVLHSIIRDRLKLRDDDESRVLFAAYPSLVSRTISGDLCLTGRATMTVSEIYEAKPETVIKQADSFTDDMLSLLKKYVEPWTYVTGHRNKFAGHGYCAVANDGPNESGAETAEVTNMPYMSFTAGPGFLQWQFYNPAVSLFPYESRARWFRTFNDDYMIINYSKTAVVPPGEPAEYNNPIDLAKATLGGPMHPTAEGQAHIADAVIQEALSKLRAGSKGNQ
jgi:hypothetical protein